MRELLIQLAVTAPVLLFSMTLHEVSHGYMAYRLGDWTAASQKRLSLNPLRHLDPFGTLLLVMTFIFSAGRMMFGWAKPVPVNPGNFKSHQRGMAWVGIAGPSANLLLAGVSALVLNIFYPDPASTSGLLPIAIFRIFQLNVILMVFNLIPVPPLDGSRIVGAFLTPRSYIKWIKLDQYGQFFIMALLLIMLNFGNGFYTIIMPIYQLFLPGYGF
ncbi:MAG: site-2 protease family protein [Thermoleophilia bacterium]|nr:site-2 protease family protein [Thermoleophilia bacterium]